GRGLALADLVAVDDENVGARPGQLARDGESGEAGTADEDVAVAIERRAVLTALRGSARHGGGERGEGAAPSAAHRGRQAPGARKSPGPPRAPGHPGGVTSFWPLALPPPL